MERDERPAGRSLKKEITLYHEDLFFVCFIFLSQSISMSIALKQTVFKIKLRNSKRVTR